jgi:Icc protein
MNRRSLIKSLSFAGAAGLIGRSSEALVGKPAQPESFSFIFFTDTHIQPELNATEGCRLCFSKFSGISADFAICGGDLVYDALAVDGVRADAVYDLYKQTASQIHLPIHYVIGNHDVFGILPRSGVATTDPQYGKKAFEDRYGATRYSYDHKGWHFIVLDSIGINPDRTWSGLVGPEQIEWLKADLAETGKTTPIIVVSHVPLVTGAISYVSHKDWLTRTNNLGGLIDSLMVTDAADVIDVLLGYNVRAVLQGHTHMNEDITFRGIRFITSGAVSGNWWKGVRAGSPEGFSTVRLTTSGGVETAYHPYGFKATPQG